MKKLSKASGGKIILLIMDGLGGIPIPFDGLTSLEAAYTPNLDSLTNAGTLGLSHPISRGIIPGSGPAHLSLFGYDPVAVDVGRGVLSALGVGLDFKSEDVAARGNFCTIDDNGLITDRRAGRIGADISKPLIEKLNRIEVDGVETQVALVKEYRFVLTLRGRGLSGDLADTDPQVTGKAPLAARALTDSAALTATHVQNWLDQAREVLRDDTPANMVTLRGFGRDPQLPKFKEIYKLRAACIAEYPMYKGVARLVGMDVLDVPKKMTPAEEFQVAVDNWDDYDFFFIHIKPTDSLGEDGNWEGKKQVIETVDQALPTLLAKSPEVLVVTGDHSTPARLKSHSWHPVPTLISAPATQMADRATRFGEREAQQYGGLGHISAQEIMPLAMAHALRLGKFGA